MCLLICDFAPQERTAVLFGANRDERLDRATAPFGVLLDEPVRVLGGRDLVAGGTWLAVSELGVVAGLTNRPSPAGPDPARASRGELPLLAASQRDARAAVDALRERVVPGAFNPAWLLVGDRDSLHYVEVDDERGAVVEELPPGRYVLENRPLGEQSTKVDRVRALLPARRAEVRNAMTSILADHVVPPVGATSDERRGALAACVHTDAYGTRSSMVVEVARSLDELPRVYVAEGPPCEVPYVDRTALWGTRSPSRTRHPS